MLLIFILHNSFTLPLIRTPLIHHFYISHELQLLSSQRRAMRVITFFYWPLPIND